MKQYTNVVLNGVLASAGGDGIQGCVDGVVIYWEAGVLGVEWAQEFGISSSLVHYV